MDSNIQTKEYVVFDTNVFTAEQNKPGGDRARAVKGIVRAGDKNAAQDSASTIFPDKMVFVQDISEAQPDYQAAGKKMGYINTSEAHPYL